MRCLFLGATDANEQSEGLKVHKWLNGNIFHLCKWQRASLLSSSLPIRLNQLSFNRTSWTSNSYSATAAKNQFVKITDSKNFYFRNDEMWRESLVLSARTTKIQYFYVYIPNVAHGDSTPKHMNYIDVAYENASICFWHFISNVSKLNMVGQNSFRMAPLNIQRYTVEFPNFKAYIVENSQSLCYNVLCSFEKYLLNWIQNICVSKAKKKTN